MCIKFERAIKEETNKRTNSQETNKKSKSSIRLDLKGDDKNTFSPRETIKGKDNHRKLQEIIKDKKDTDYFRSYRICSSSKDEEKN